MISTDSKSDEFKSPIQTIKRESLQIRTNKHRCFVFCIGHRSLTCVPGIGKKNEYLLNQSGIHDLAALYSKYRSINDIQHFTQWLQNDIGFTSYQAKMTTCGLSSKLGKIKEMNTGLLPLCYSSRKKHNLVPSVTKLIKHEYKEKEQEKEEKEAILEKLKADETRAEMFLTNFYYGRTGKLSFYSSLHANLCFHEQNKNRSYIRDKANRTRFIFNHS